MLADSGKVGDLVEKMYFEEKVDPEFILRELFSSYVALTHLISEEDESIKIKSLHLLDEAINLIIL